MSEESDKFPAAKPSAPDSGKYAMMKSLEDKISSILEPAQNSETTPTCGPDSVRVAVCHKCAQGFALHCGEFSVQCPCRASIIVRHPGYIAVGPTATDITSLIECGKLSVHEMPNGAIVIAAHNKARRGEPKSEPTATERVECASEAIGKVVGAAVGFMTSAAQMGARVSFVSHYHQMPTGTVSDGVTDWLTRLPTGNARYCGQVITGDCKDEADHSIIYSPVINCARCGSSHEKPLAFWRLSKPVQEFDPLTVGSWKVTATHFAFCPTNGEPIIMMNSATPEVEEAAALVAPASAVTLPPNPTQEEFDEAQRKMWQISSQAPWRKRA